MSESTARKILYGSAAAIVAIHGIAYFCGLMEIPAIRIAVGVGFLAVSTFGFTARGYVKTEEA